MEKHGCFNGDLDTSKYGSPMTAIGIYIAVANLVCFLSMSFDLLYGFRSRKLWLPTKLFPLNSATLTIVSVATKLTVDLNSPMPRAIEQLSKLSGSVFLCNSMAFFLPSLATMSKSECIANLAALSIQVITIVVNLCIQLSTGVIFAFVVEHLIIIFCMLVLLMSLWSSSSGLYFLNQTWEPKLKDGMKEELQGTLPIDIMKQELKNTHVKKNIKMPLFFCCDNPNNFTEGALCFLTTALLAEATIRSLAVKELRFCTGASDYNWSIWWVVITQLLAIAISSFAVIFRWLISVTRMSLNRFKPLKEVFEVEKCWLLGINVWRYQPLPFKFPNESFENFIKQLKDLIFRFLIRIQRCIIWTGLLVKFLCLMLRKAINCGVEMRQSSNSSNFHDDEYREDEELAQWVQSILTEGAKRLLTRDYDPTHFIRLLSPTQSLNTQSLLSNIEETASKEHVKDHLSGFSLLVLTKIAIVSLPPEDTKSLTQALKEVIKIILFVDKKFNRNFMSARNMWWAWDNPNYWIHKQIMDPAKKTVDAQEKVYENRAVEIIRQVGKNSSTSNYRASHIINIISESILSGQHGSIEKLSECIKQTFREMVIKLIKDLPLAISKEYSHIRIEKSEETTTTALEFLRKFEILEMKLGDKVQWKWPENAERVSHNTPTTGKKGAKEESSSAIGAVSLGDKDVILEIGSEGRK